MQVTQTHRNSLTDNADGGRSTTIIPNNYSPYKEGDFIIKEIIDFKGYFISDDGKVYCNLGKGNRNKNKIVDLYEIKPRLTKKGYARVYARQTSTNKRKDLYIHRLVAEYFIPNPENKKYVNHKNCKRDDNNVSNLEWCTAKENTEYTMKNGYMKRNKKTGRYESNFEYVA